MKARGQSVAAMGPVLLVVLLFAVPFQSAAAAARAAAETSQTVAEAAAGAAVARVRGPVAVAAPPLPLPGALASASALLGSKAHDGAFKLVSAGEAGAGQETQLAGLSAYVSAPATDGLNKMSKKFGAAKKIVALPAPKAAIVLYSDIYGWRGNGTRLWADRLASLGYVAVVPDFFAGRSAAPGPNQAEDRAYIIALPKANVTREAGAVIAAIKQAYPSVARVAAYGFCWGGRYAAVAAGTGAGPAAADAAVAYHASLVSAEEFAAISRPILFVNAAGDALFNATAVAGAEEARARNARTVPPVEVALRTFEGVRHGFAVRAAPNDTVATAAAESAFQDGLAFLKKQGVTP